MDGLVLKPVVEELPPLKKKKFNTTLNKAEKMQVIEYLMATGETNQYVIAEKVGCSQPNVRTLMQAIRKENVREDNSTVKEKRATRIRQLAHIHRLALTKFADSCKEEVEVSTTIMKCGICSGVGKVNNEKCLDCDGSGKSEIIKTKITQKSGDSSYIRIAVDCVKESGKLEGSYMNPTTEKATIKRLLKESKMVGGELQERVEEIYFEAPLELILKAKATIDELKRKSNDAIEAESKKVSIT